MMTATYAPEARRDRLASQEQDLQREIVRMAGRYERDQAIWDKISELRAVRRQMEEENNHASAPVG